VPCRAGATAGDGRHDPAADLVAVDLMVVATVGKNGVGSAARTARPAANRRNRVKQGQQPGDVTRGGCQSA
jgi:hypothetical protein